MATFYTDQTHCLVQRLSSAYAETESMSVGSFRSFENQQLLLISGQAFPVTSAVTVEHDDVLFIGEVIGCTADGEDTWKVLIQVHQLLNGLHSLMVLRELRLWSEGQSRLQALTPNSTLV